MSHISLHPTLGVNPRLTICQRCGETGMDLVLLGNKNTKFTCDACDTVSFASKHCLNQKCSAKYRGRLEQLTDGEKIPGGICAPCKEAVEVEKSLVKEGGIYFRCSDCLALGVIKKCGFSDSIRKSLGIEEGPAGIEFSNKDCPACGPNKVSHEGQ